MYLYKLVVRETTLHWFMALVLNHLTRNNTLQIEGNFKLESHTSPVAPMRFCHQICLYMICGSQTSVWMTAKYGYEQSLQVNSLWPSDGIWRHRPLSTLAQVMPCCLTAPSHYLNQCWLIVSTDKWRLYKGSFTNNAPPINQENQLQFAYIKFLSNLPETNELIGAPHI